MPIKDGVLQKKKVGKFNGLVIRQIKVGNSIKNW